MLTSYGESGDINDTAQLAVFKHGADKNLEVSENLLNLIPLTENTTGEEIFIAVYHSLESKELDWQKLVSLATDGAPAKAGAKKGLFGRLRSYLESMGRTEKLYNFHFIIHQQALCAKVMNMSNVIDLVL